MGWSGLGPTVQAAWADQAILLTDPRFAVVSSPNQSGYQLFVSTNLILGPYGGPIISEPFDTPTLPVPIGSDLALTATNSDAGFSLLLSTPNDIGGKITVYASAPQISTRASFADSQCVLIQTATHLETGTPLDLTAAYLQIYRRPANGWRIAVQVAPVSSTGLRLPRKTFTALVAPSE